jgi:protein translocase SEC61 complex gamma subunit
MNIKGTIKSIISTLKYSRKSSKEEYLLYLKLVFIALFLVGGIGIIIHLVASTISYLFPGG